MPKKNLNYLEDQAVTKMGAVDLSDVSSKIKELLGIEAEIEQLEEALKNKKSQKDKLSGDVIPTLMQEMGLKSAEMEDGSKVNIDEAFHCRIPKPRTEEAYEYLRDNNLGDLIKNQVSMSFGKGEDSNADQLKTYIEGMGFIPEVKSSVHPGTLKATLKRRHEDGISDPQDLFEIFIRQNTKITNNKG